MEECQPTLKDGTTEQYKLVFKWPFQLGLFLIVSLKLVLILGTLMEFTLPFFQIFIISDFQLLVLLVLPTVIYSLDFCLALFSICVYFNLTVKDEGLLRMYYKYTVYIFGSLTVYTALWSVVMSYLNNISFLSVSSPHLLSKVINMLPGLVGILFFYTVIQFVIYTIVRWETESLKNSEELVI